MSHPRLCLPMLIVACIGIAGCGGSRTESSRRDGSASAALSAGYRVRDVDEDYDNAHGTGTRYDLDDDPILYYSHIAGPADTTAITRLVTSYYAAAAAADGAAGCALVYAPIAESLPEEYAASSAVGQTCATVLSKVFRQKHAQYALRHASLDVTSVRVEGDQGFALLAFKGLPDHHLRVHRENGRWTVHQLLDEGLP